VRLCSIACQSVPAIWSTFERFAKAKANLEALRCLPPDKLREPNRHGLLLAHLKLKNSNDTPEQLGLVRAVEEETQAQDRLQARAAEVAVQVREVPFAKPDDIGHRLFVANTTRNSLWSKLNNVLHFNKNHRSTNDGNGSSIVGDRWRLPKLLFV